VGEHTSAFDAALGEVTQERGQDYGDVGDNFRRIAALQAEVADCEDAVVRVALEMICLKLARLVHSTHMDSVIDIAGYARCIALYLDEEADARARRSP